jgi:hypothetical protein
MQLVQHPRRPRRVEQRDVLRRVTMTAPSSATCWASVSCASPVPGGRSTIRKSCVPHSGSLRNWRTAPITIGPRQITGVFSVRKKPIEMSFTP